MRGGKSSPWGRHTHGRTAEQARLNSRAEAVSVVFMYAGCGAAAFAPWCLWALLCAVALLAAGAAVAAFGGVD